MLTYEYCGDFHTVKVNSWGYVRFDRWQVYLSETMIGERIEFRPGESSERFVACYRDFVIAELYGFTSSWYVRSLEQ